MRSSNSMPIQLGTRKVLKGSKSLVLNIPLVAVRSLGLSAGDTLVVSMTIDGKIIFQKIDGD